MKLQRGKAYHEGYQKKLFEGVTQGLAVPAAMPIGLAQIALIPLIDGHKPLIKQKRVGLADKDVDMYKFQTMPPGTPHVPSTEGWLDPRRTRLGQLLAKLHFDETAQIINVLLGDMNIVGPRPKLRCEHDAAMDDLSSNEQRQFKKVNSFVVRGIMDVPQLEKYTTGKQMSPRENALWVIEYGNNGTMIDDMTILAETIGYFATTMAGGDSEFASAIQDQRDAA